MVGCILSAAHRHVALVFDNAVTGSAVLVAQALQPAVTGYVFPSAAYAEPVHQMQMEYLHMKPVVSDPGKDDQAWIPAHRLFRTRRGRRIHERRLEKPMPPVGIGGSVIPAYTTIYRNIKKEVL